MMTSPEAASASASAMAITYNCKECGADLKLSSERLYPSGVYFEAGDKNTLSFFWIDGDRFKFDKEDKIRPFFETLDCWGLHRNRTKISCRNCGFLLGHIYDDGPPLTDAHYPFGPSQVIPRNPRFRFFTTALISSSNTHPHT